MDGDEDFADDFEPWTATGAAELVAAGEALAGAVREHARALAALTESQDIGAVFAGSEVLLPVALAYADAQFNLTGNGFPFGPLHDFADEDDVGDGEEEEAVIGSGLSVLSRQDFVLTDEAAALAAGRAAYAGVWPEDPPTAAAQDVTSIGRALYQFAHLNGWTRTGRCQDWCRPARPRWSRHTRTYCAATPTSGREPFSVDAPVIYSQSDIYG